MHSPILLDDSFKGDVERWLMHCISDYQIAVSNANQQQGTSSSSFFAVALVLAVLAVLDAIIWLNLTKYVYILLPQSDV